MSTSSYSLYAARLSIQGGAPTTGLGLPASSPHVSGTSGPGEADFSTLHGIRNLGEGGTGAAPSSGFLLYVALGTRDSDALICNTPSSTGSHVCPHVCATGKHKVLTWHLIETLPILGPREPQRPSLLVPGGSGIPKGQPPTPAWTRGAADRGRQAQAPLHHCSMSRLPGGCAGSGGLKLSTSW